jgi:hypothetical protein
MYRAVFSIYFLIAGLSLSIEARAQAQQAPPPAPEVEPPPLLTVPPGYRYDPRGRRDPFVNPVPKPAVEEQPAPPPVVRPPGLRGVLVNEATIIGVVTSKEPGMNVVVIQAPGARIYFAARGDSLFDGVVKEIKADAVVFELPGIRRQGEPTPPREVVRRVRATPGE